MSVASRAAPATLPVERRERVSAWGGATHVESWVYRPESVDAVRDVFDLARRHRLTVGLRGAGQSYGDASLNRDGITLDLSRMRRILAWDPEHGVARVEPGVTFGALWRHTIADGWWPAVVPGTMHVSLGGAAAMNVHGKNNWKVGPLGEHVRELDLLLPSGELRRVTPDDDPELFRAVVGGFGMLGCITSVTVALKRVHSGLLDVEAVSAPSLGDMIDVFAARLGRADYLVGWVDCFARGAALGRGLVHHASYLAPGADPAPHETLHPAAQELPGTLFGVVPRSLAWAFMRPITNQLGGRLVNAVKHRLGRREHGTRYRQPHVQFAFLLDYVPGWKRAYGPGGLIQYQSFVPAAAASETFRAILARAQACGEVPLLGVFKRHRPDAFLMTHALDGFSLALDFRVTAANRARVWALAAELDRIVVGAGGRFYFAKDSTLSHRSFAPFLAEERARRFMALKRRLDPEALLATDLYRRLFVD